MFKKKRLGKRGVKLNSRRSRCGTVGPFETRCDQQFNEEHHQREAAAQAEDDE